ncbi:helix-turn-helix transcriptional regulator [Caproiciproducens galactitolivorans]|uniref:HTH-type transcriptional regulator ImmR n=1 Tax=Caproiciproducens galactitolivorans TaxID=642589 RepID=A0A4Z0YIG8_9FIRM|nr:helix-turn-helix transcriptional regulator [Caproiciproducens galactitolivorans]QEY35685.1 helix-turn-helix transcriptional regulator [Caproiciproducens galactitolivorans]TGJ77416.1 HTH-type transcriptional regulator ImmR [Caproiciproducens galactitolivorans]
MKFPERLHNLRNQRGLSQAQLARDIGAHPMSIGNYERGNRYPSVLTLCCLAEFFGVSTDYLLGRTDKM